MANTREIKNRIESVQQTRKITNAMYLKRLSMGPLTLDEGLKAGEYRLLTAQEIERLRER